MKILILFALIISMIGIMYCYNYYQNNKFVIGGKISGAKTFWLGYAIFYYFGLPWWILIFVPQNEWNRFTLYASLGIFYFRMLLQIFLMFLTKNWSPLIGISYNIAAAFILTYFLISSIIVNTFTINDYILNIYIFNVILILITDTYYAKCFYKLVGQDTKGEKAIWFASDEEKFARINRITRRNNLIFILLSLVLLLLLIQNALH